MLSSHGARMNLASSLMDFCNAAGTLRTKAGVASDAVVHAPELAHLAPLLEQMQDSIPDFFMQFVDAIPPALGEAMENAQEFALEE